MKKIIVILAFLTAFLGYSQTDVNVTYVEGIAYKSFTTTELDAIATKVDGDAYFDSTKGRPVYWYDGAWRDSSGSSVSNGDKGDITVTNSGDTWTIDNGAITNSKIADNSIVPGKLIDNVGTGMILFDGSGGGAFSATLPNSLLATKSIPVDRINSLISTDGYVLTADGSGGAAFEPIGGAGSLDATIIDGSTNAVEGNAIYDALALKASTSSLASYLLKSGGTMTGGVNFGNNDISNLANLYVNNLTEVNKLHFIPLGTSTLGWEMRSQTSGDDLVFLSETLEDSGTFSPVKYKLNDSGTPTDATDLTTKSYVDGKTTTVINNLTSTSTTSALSAAQGKVLQDGTVKTSGTNTMSGTYNISSSLALNNSPMYIGGTGASNQIWRIYKSNSNQDLEFSWSATNPTFTTPYKLNDSGTPTDNTDLITKGFADANYSGGGTDDQTAAEVSVDASGFDGNLDTGDDDVQKVAQKLDDLNINLGGGIVAEGVETMPSGSGNRTITVTHSLGYSPASSRIQLQSVNITTIPSLTINNITSTTFDIISNTPEGNFIAWRIFGTDSETPLDFEEVASGLDTELGSSDWRTGGTPADGSITLAKMADANANSFIGNNTGSAVTPIYLTTTQARAMLNVADGATADLNLTNANQSITGERSINIGPSGGDDKSLTINAYYNPIARFTSTVAGQPLFELYDYNNHLGGGAVWVDPLQEIANAGGGLSTDNQNKINNAVLPPKTVVKSSDFTLTATDDIFETGTDIGRKINNVVTAADTIVVTVADVGDVDDIFRFQTKGTNSGFDLLPDDGVTLNWNGKDGEDGIRIVGVDVLAYLQKTATDTYSILVNEGTFTAINGLYSPNNLYTEASAVNADNIVSTAPAGFGGWTRDGASSVTYQSIVASTGGTASTHAMRVHRPSPGATYEQVQFTKTGLTNGANYKVRFKHKYVSGSRLTFESRDGGTRVDVTTVDGATTFTQFEYTWTQVGTESAFWLVLNWGLTGEDETVEFTDFEILLQP